MPPWPQVTPQVPREVLEVLTADLQMQ